MGRTSRLGDLERAVMERLWSDEERSFTVREVHDALGEERGVAYTTVMTVMDRLARKDLVVQERDGRAYRYRAAASRSRLTAEVMREALTEFSIRDRRQALVAFVGDADAEERAALREALAELEAREA